MNPTVLVTFGLLTAAIGALWLPPDERGRPRPLAWVTPLVAAIGCGLFARILEPMGLLGIGAMAGAAWLYARDEGPRWQRNTGAIAVIAFAVALMTHQFPGFNNPRVIEEIRLTAEALPYRLHFNFDKPLVGLFLLAFCHARIAHVSEWCRMLKRAAPVIGLTLAVTTLLSLFAGYVAFSPKLPALARVWLWANLVFTCVAEEAFFRGFMQAGLARAWQNVRGGGGLALLVAAIVFGLAHAAGGASYVGLATIAGAGYGWAYQRTGRIEAAILTHFVLNTVHFFGFTYPALAAAVR